MRDLCCLTWIAERLHNQQHDTLRLHIDNCFVKSACDQFTRWSSTQNSDRYVLRCGQSAWYAGSTSLADTSGPRAMSHLHLLRSPVVSRASFLRSHSLHTAAPVGFRSSETRSHRRSKTTQPTQCAATLDMGVDASKKGSNGSNGAAHKQGYNATYKTLEVGDQMAAEYSDDTASAPKNRRAGTVSPLLLDTTNSKRRMMIASDCCRSMWTKH